MTKIYLELIVGKINTRMNYNFISVFYTAF